MDETEFKALMPKFYGMSHDARFAAMKRMTAQQQKLAVVEFARAHVASVGATTTTPKSEPRISDEQVAAIYSRREQVTAPPPTDSRGAPSFGTDAHVNAIYARRAQASGAEHIGTPD